MKISRLLASVCLLALALLSGGCAAIIASSTRFEYSKPTGERFVLTLPKNIDAKTLDVSVDPATGQFHVKADVLKSDASGVINSATAMQADALSKLAATVSALAAPKP